MSRSTLAHVGFGRLGTWSHVSLALGASTGRKRVDQPARTRLAITFLQRPDVAVPVKRNLRQQFMPSGRNAIAEPPN